MIEIRIDGKTIRSKPGTTVAAAILNAGTDHFRASVRGGRRGPLCGMGICFECRVKINGAPGQRSCTILVEQGMEIETAANEDSAADSHG